MTPKIEETLDGYELAQKEFGDEKIEYFYRDKNGNNVFMTQAQLDAMMSAKDSIEAVNVDFQTTYTKTKTKTYNVTGIVENSDKTGRYTSISVYNDETSPEELRGKEFSLAVTQVFDENGYNDAFNDYEYEKAEYEKSISDINAQTEVIQQEDQQLELRLQQLDTEQNAISTEMEAVTKVIDNNVEKTFKVFA